MKECFVLKTKSGWIRILLSEILYFESELRIVHVHTKSGIHSGYNTLGILMKRLDEQFLRCHCSYIVNLENVSGYSRFSFSLENGECLPISQRYATQTKRAYLRFVKNDPNSGLVES